jgi:GAF domain-containing protein
VTASDQRTQLAEDN